jgi:hypothetical protein
MRRSFRVCRIENEIGSFGQLGRGQRYSPNNLEQSKLRVFFIYLRKNGDIDIQARMFAPLHGIPEDPQPAART